MFGVFLLYCVKENQHPPVYQSLYLSIFFSPMEFSVTDFSARMRAMVFKIYIHLESDQIYCGKEIQNTEIYFCLLYPFFLFSISHYNVVHREICVKDFAGTIMPRILKFDTHVEYDLLYYVKRNQTPSVYHSLYLSIFVSLQ